MRHETIEIPCGGGTSPGSTNMVLLEHIMGRMFCVNMVIDKSTLSAIYILHCKDSSTVIDCTKVLTKYPSPANLK